MRTRVGLLVLVVASLTFGACAGDDAVTTTDTTETTKPSGPSVTLTVDETAAGAVAFQMKANGITIEPAGEVHAGAGHFHLIADAECLAAGTVIPKDADHVHLGKGQLEGKIYLGPGEHTLCLQVGDGAHNALAVTDTGKVTVHVHEKEEWCGAHNDIEGLYKDIAGLGADFPAQQLAYNNVRRLIAQLDDGIDAVPAANRDDVTEELANSDKYAAAFTDATDATDAAARVKAAFPKGRDDATPGRAWITENCPAPVA